MQVALILKGVHAQLLVLLAPFQQPHTSIKREMWCLHLRELEKNLTANNGGDFAQKKVVQKNLKGEVTVPGT
jgi:hypothetical protein